MTAPATFAADADAAYRQYLEVGFHVEPDLVAHDFCDKLIDHASEFPGVRKGDFRTVLQPHRQHETFLQALRLPAVTRIVRLLLGDAISGIQTQFFYCKPGTPGFQPHQDNRFVNAPTGAFASAWLALT